MPTPIELETQIKSLLPAGVDFDAFIEKYQDTWDNADTTKQDILDLVWRGNRAKEFSLEGWKHFYWCMYRREYPDAHLPIINSLIAAVNTKRAKMVQAWRGFGKSTDLLLFVVWMVGINPVGSTGYVRINETKAQLTGDVISEIIETSKGWRASFPNVIPDKKAGWSSEKGYNVLDTNVTGLPDSPKFGEGYSKWRQMCLSDHPTESSIMCAGIESGLIIGWHPTNGMYFDDLHDERNTRSMVEMQKVVDILEGNIIPTWFTPRGKPIMACVCTPWDSDRDAYHALLQTRLFDLIQIPIYTEDENGELFEPLQKRVRLAWPESYPMERVVEIYNASTKRFYQMYLLDDKAAKSVGYTYHRFPYGDLNWKTWTVTTGVDPKATVSGISKGKGISHFAMSHVLETPYNTLVVGGGYVKKVPADVGEAAMADFARTHSNFRAASVESNGAGALFISLSARNVGLILHPHMVSELGHGTKITRQFNFLEPMLSNGILLIAEGATGNYDFDEYFSILTSALDRYPNIQPDEPEADVLDSLCMAVLDIPRVWSRVHTNVASNMSPQQQNKTTSPIKELGSYSYLRG